jgi:mercuric reductase
VNLVDCGSVRERGHQARPFVDLITPSLAVYAKAPQPLTVNGVHLTDEGVPRDREAGYIDSTDALSLSALPKSLIVIGGWSDRAGVRTTLHPFWREGESRGGTAHGDGRGPGNRRRHTDQVLEGEKVTVCANVNIPKVERQYGEYRVSAEINSRKEVYHAESAYDRHGAPSQHERVRPRKGLGRIGTEWRNQGEQTLQTSNLEFYAACDCIGDPMFLYLAA